MTTIPRYILAIIPVATFWYAHSCIKKRNYKLLWIVLLALCVPLFTLAYFKPMLSTWYGGPKAATGIFTIQIPLSMIATALILLLKSEKIAIRIIIYAFAIVVGEVLLINIWVA